MLNYTLNIPQHRKVNKTNSNVVGVFDYKSIALPSELLRHSGCKVEANLAPELAVYQKQYKLPREK